MNVILVVAGLVCEAIAALLGFGVFNGTHLLGWVALGLVFYLASLLAGPVTAYAAGRRA